MVLGALAGMYVSLFGALLMAVAGNTAGIAADNLGLQKFLIGAIGPRPTQLLGRCPAVGFWTR